MRSGDTLALEARAVGPVRPSFLMARVQETIVERSSAPVLAEAGNAFSLATH
ncbi:MAG: hypothetical protein QM756_18935 [Polyangiaceae bacterium]